jgi:hypothetical protein
MWCGKRHCGSLLAHGGNHSTVVRANPLIFDQTSKAGSGLDDLLRIQSQIAQSMTTIARSRIADR